MTARILVYSDDSGAPLYIEGVPTRTIADDILRNYPQYPQEVPLFASHQWGAAYGWVRNLTPQDDGLYAEIELTPDGEQLVRSETYKYVSPGVVYDLQLPSGETLKGWTLIEVSLTNMPAQYGGASIVKLQRAAPIQQQEDATMTRDELAQTITEILAPLTQRIEQIENALREQEQKRREDELAQTVAQLSREIQSWRYNNDAEAIPPRIANSYALMLARMPEPARTELLLTLKHNPPLTMPITALSNANPAQHNSPLTPLQEKYANLLGVSPETFLKYNTQEA
jgi:phage I-like protein